MSEIIKTKYLKIKELQLLFTKFFKLHAVDIYSILQLVDTFTDIDLTTGLNRILL